MKTRFAGDRLYQDDAIQKTEDQNDCLAIERIIHLRRQNTTRASTRVFPVEILSHIFSCVLYDTEHISFGQRAFVRLGHVCSKWRDIILSIPHFWSKFQLDVEEWFCKMPDLPLLLLYVKNSGSSPFCLVVSFGRCNSHPLDRVKKSFKQLERHVPRVHTLTVLYMPGKWDEEVFFPSWWSSIENLTIWDAMASSHFSLKKFTRLRNLVIKGFLGTIELPRGLTSLKILGWPIDYCISLLMRCPNLVEFYALHAKWELLKRDSPLFKRIQNLEHLSLAYETVGECNSLYHHLQFPSLRTFSWRSSFRKGYYWEFPSEDPTKDEMSALRFLIPSFPPTISQLNLFGVSEWPDEFIEFFFLSLKSLQTVHLLECEPYMVVDFLSLLNRPDDRERFYILPSIAKVVIRLPSQALTSAGKGMEDELASLLVSLFHLRDPYKRGRFSLQIMLRENDSMEKVHETYISMKKDGYAFEICQVTESIVPEYLYQVGIDDVPRHRDDVSRDKDDF